ncbi:MAG TPA: SDR family NAD(P)-dependent oxidoreductase [Pseudomonadales bacterium]
MTKRVALVTGAASGIGAEVCRQLAATGLELVLLDVDSEHGETLAGELGGHFIGCDVADRAAWFAAVNRCIETVGVPHFAHLNAGVMSVSPREAFVRIEDLPEANYHRIVGVNLAGVVFGLQALLPHMRSRSGAICVTASLAGLVPLPFDPMYAATKHALVGLVRSVAAAGPGDQLRINAICPGGVDTPIIPDVLRSDEMAVMPVAVLAAEVVDLLERGDNGEIRLKRGAGVAAEAVPAPVFGGRASSGERRA